MEKKKDLNEKLISKMDIDSILNFLNSLMNINDYDYMTKKLDYFKKKILKNDDKSELYGKKNLNSENGKIIFYLDKITNSFTIERRKYYIKILIKYITSKETNKYNDININRWKDYENILTDSLWIFNKRESSGQHLAWYWGNFIPQIPYQTMMRYTKKNEWVLDPFLGSGTTLIECRRIGRNGIGIELNAKIAEKAKELIEKEENIHNVITDIYVGDSRKISIENILSKYNIKNVNFLILHPPYHNIIKFSDNDNDLSNAKNTEEFLKMFGEVLDNLLPFLENERYLVLVIGDKYSDGEWIPLGFYTMEEVKKRGLILKSIVVKNFEETRAKRYQKELWRYRALKNDYYIFKHEYVMIFKKK
ncbi:MAG: DNA methyltransferase [Thermoplasmata archaeon]|nr:hypothetical protein [Staphylococcus epidermidis]